jgi:hypothetical protein
MDHIRGHLLHIESGSKHIYTSTIYI